MGGLLVRFGHGGLDGLEEEGEALVVGDRAAGGQFEGGKAIGKAAEDGADPPTSPPSTAPTAPATSQPATGTNYADAIAKHQKTHLLIVETTGAHSAPLMGLLRGLAAQAAAKSAIDRTVYGEARHSPPRTLSHITWQPSPQQCSSPTHSSSATPPRPSNSPSPCPVK